MSGNLSLAVFPELSYVDCYQNKLTGLNLSKNTKLEAHDRFQIFVFTQIQTL